MFVCRLCSFRTKHSSSMVRHLKTEHRFSYDKIREKWKEVVEERNVVVIKDNVDIMLENVKRI